VYRQAKVSTKMVKPKAMPKLDAPMKIELDSHRRICEDALKLTMADSQSDEAARSRAVLAYRKPRKTYSPRQSTGRKWWSFGYNSGKLKRRKLILTGQRVKRIAAGMRRSVSPPPGTNTMASATF
jgi:hypothetical protein